MSKFIEGDYNVKRQRPVKASDISIGCLCVRTMLFTKEIRAYYIINSDCGNWLACGINTSNGKQMHLDTSPAVVNYNKVWYPVIPHRIP